MSVMGDAGGSVKMAGSSLYKIQMSYLCTNAAALDVNQSSIRCVSLAAEIESLRWSWTTPVIMFLWCRVAWTYVQNLDKSSLGSLRKAYINSLNLLLRLEVCDESVIFIFNFFQKKPCANLNFDLSFYHEFFLVALLSFVLTAHTRYLF